MKRTVVTVLSAFLLTSCIIAEDSMKLWYDKPASNKGKASWENENQNYTNKGNPDKDWERLALPIGNGSIGAMIFGGIDEERVQFNEKSVWAGGPRAEGYKDSNRKDVYKKLPEIRRLLISGDKKGAEKLAKESLTGLWIKKKTKPGLFGRYQTFGEMYFKTGIDPENVTEYYRDLNLDSGTVSVKFKYNEAEYKREYFVSYPDQVLVMNFTADKKGRQNLEFSMDSPHSYTVRYDKNQIIFDGKLKDNGMKIATGISIRIEAGKMEYKDEKLIIRDADSVTFILSADTDYIAEYPDYRGIEPLKSTAAILSKVKNLSYNDLLKRHLKDHRSLFRRVSLKLGGNRADSIPTDTRVNNYKKTPSDLTLEELYFNFGRYLLISSSRPGNLPANLQGIWCNETVPAWNSDYHLNINLQMNYWPAESCNLGECHMPFIDYIDSLREPGKITAKNYFNARGWTTNLRSNIYGHTAPSGGKGPMFWKYFPLSGAWLSQHVWEHYAFTKDKKYLKEKAYPILKSQAEFVMDYLYKDKDGTLLSCPSWSPEHGPISLGTSTDHQMAWDLLNNVAEAAEELNVDPEERKKWTAARDRISPPKIGKYGQLQEWKEDIDKKNDKHRHVNHLFAVFPGRQISPLTTPELANAARKTLEIRGDGGTGWSMGWKINFWARLHDGDHAYLLFQNLLKKGTSTNLFDLHPPFQIDGNFGGTSGIAEMLLQSHSGKIHLLPALPSAWKDGEVKGLCARGGFEVSMKWKDGKLIDAEILSKNEGKCEVLYEGKTTGVELEKNVPFHLKY